MNTVNERFRAIRKYFAKNQEEWGNILGITRAGVSDIEAGRRNVTDKHIRLLCIEPIDGKYISENYLRTGEGEMFLKLPEDDETALYVSELLENSDNPFCELIVEVMRTYEQLSPKSKAALSEAATKLMENLTKKKGG